MPIGRGRLGDGIAVLKMPLKVSTAKELYLKVNSSPRFITTDDIKQALRFLSSSVFDIRIPAV